MQMTETIRRQMVTTKLTQFYRQYCPQKLYVVNEAYQQFQDRLPELFAELLKKYPRAPQNTFDDLLALLCADGSVGPDQGRDAVIDEDEEGAKAVPLSQLVQVLGDGERLLAASPPRMDENLNRSKLEATTAANEAMDQELEQLNSLVEENRALAQEVAIAEMQVLDKRFEILIRRCLRDADNRASQSSILRHDNVSQSRTEPEDGNHQSLPPEGFSEAEMTMALQVVDGSRVFQVPMNNALWQYINQGALRTPLPPEVAPMGGEDPATLKASREQLICVVQPSHVSRSVSVTKVVLAMAMRHWSRCVPHTVTEIINGEPRFHSSGTFWWQWPSTPTTIRGVKAESMLNQDFNALTALDVVMQMDRKDRPFNESVLTLFEEKPTVDRSSADSDYWAFFLDQWDLLGHRLDNQHQSVV